MRERKRERPIERKYERMNYENKNAGYMRLNCKGEQDGQEGVWGGKGAKRTERI